MLVGLLLTNTVFKTGVSQMWESPNCQRPAHRHSHNLSLTPPPLLLALPQPICLLLSNAAT